MRMRNVQAEKSDADGKNKSSGKTNHVKKPHKVACPVSRTCCVPGLARLLNGDVRYIDTNIGQSPAPG
jgi:hypothetical protein